MSFGIKLSHLNVYTGISNSFLAYLIISELLIQYKLWTCPVCNEAKPYHWMSVTHTISVENITCLCTPIIVLGFIHLLLPGSTHGSYHCLLFHNMSIRRHLSRAHLFVLLTSSCTFVVVYNRPPSSQLWDTDYYPDSCDILHLLARHIQLQHCWLLGPGGHLISLLFS
jgi:hypothetical protein